MTQSRTSIFSLQERVTNADTVIMSEHAAIHDGVAYSAALVFDLVAAGVSYMEMVTPVTGYVHFRPETIETSGPLILAQLIEAPTLTTGSTAVVPLNRRRLGTPNVSSLVLKSDPTAVSGGAIIDQTLVGGTSGKSAGGGSASNNAEWVLKQDTVYAVKVTNSGTETATINIKAVWYEEDDA